MKRKLSFIFFSYFIYFVVDGLYIEKKNSWILFIYTTADLKGNNRIGLKRKEFG